jgi:chorismate synthase
MLPTLLCVGGSVYAVQAWMKEFWPDMSNQETVTSDGENTELQGRGRHDACVLPRAVPIVEAMATLVLTDHLLRQRAIQPIS